MVDFNFDYFEFFKSGFCSFWLMKFDFRSESFLFHKSGDLKKNLEKFWLLNFTFKLQDERQNWSFQENPPISKPKLFILALTTLF